MPVSLSRKPNRFSPDPTRVIVRFFLPGGEERAKRIIDSLASLSQDEVQRELNNILRDFSGRHRNITKILLRHFEKVAHLAAALGLDPGAFSREMQLLTGAYFTNEYSIESAAFFNPSIVEDPDQSHLPPGKKRVIVSFRATGEGHVSSIVFRSGIIDAENNLDFSPPGKFVDEAETIQIQRYDKPQFLGKLADMQLDEEGITREIFEPLGDSFTFNDLKTSFQRCSAGRHLSEQEEKVLESLKWIANAQYLISFSLDSTIPERVIFPMTDADSRGIEDARFVRFSDEGVVKYFGTYTAYNGHSILPQLIETIDFCTFKVMPIYGKYAQNKGMALFPRKINGRYAMLSRNDGENNYIMYSDKINVWDCQPEPLQYPKYPWEFVQLGNSGSPIETERGWLVITHAVGPMRKYCLGAILLDLENPGLLIARMPEPLLMANEEEREGYVPNVVYSCGALLNGDQLIIPYAMSDTRSGFATVSLDELLQNMLREPGTDRQEESTCRRILLVEDDAITGQIVKKILDNAGYETALAADGLLALVEIGKGDYDLILSDIKMPNFSGYELLEFMRNKKIDIPVMLLTGNTDQEDEIKALELGAVDYLRKPVDPQILLLKVRLRGQ